MGFSQMRLRLLFFDTAETQQAIREWLDIKENWLSENQLIIFPHNDSFDISPAHIDKGKAILKLLDYLGIDQKKVLLLVIPGMMFQCLKCVQRRLRSLFLKLRWRPITLPI